MYSNLELERLKSNLHSKLLVARNLHRIVTSISFIEAFEKASDERRKIVIEFINNNDKIKTCIWLKEELNSDLETYSIRRLRNLAQELGIKHYSYLPKASLLSAIRNHKENLNEETGTIKTDSIITIPHENFNSSSGNITKTI